MKAKLGIVAAAFGFVTIALSPAPASAQTITVGNGKADCIAKHTAVKDVKKLKDYGELRIKNRETSLAKFSDDILNKRYTKQKTQFESAKRSAEKVAKTNLNVSQPANHKDQIAQDRNNIGNALADKKERLKQANDPATVATINCEVIWDLRIASYIAPKLRAQESLDAYSNVNAVNNALYQVLLANSKQGAIKNPQESGNVINKLQQQLDMITITNASAETGTKVNPLGSKASGLFDPLKAEAKAISAEIKKTGSESRKAVSDLNKQKKADTKKNTKNDNLVVTGNGTGTALTAKQLSDKAKANKAAAPDACRGVKGSGKTASDKEARAACEYGYRTTGPNAKRQAACKTKFNSTKKVEKKNLLVTACNTGIELRS